MPQGDETPAERTGEHVAEQRRLYGESIGDLVRRITGSLGLTQARVAAILGLSPAMLSQLVGGRRVKIGNPQAVTRLQTLLALAEEAPRLTQAETARRLDEIRDSQTTLSTGQLSTIATEPSRLIRGVLQAVASGQELDRAARALDDTAPGVAELIRACGSGTDDEARRYLASLAHLI